MPVRKHSKVCDDGLSAHMVARVHTQFLFSLVPWSRQKFPCQSNGNERMNYNVDTMSVASLVYIHDQGIERRDIERRGIERTMQPLNREAINGLLCVHQASNAPVERPSKN